jgi:serine/threonine protein kinase
MKPPLPRAAAQAPSDLAPRGTPPTQAPSPARVTPGDAVPGPGVHAGLPASPPPSGVSQTVPLAAPASVTFPKLCSTCGGRYPADFNVCPRDATPLDSVEQGLDPMLGKVLGETYQVARLVGEGGMGRVYEARHLRLKDRRFAVKVLHAEFARQPEVVARFQREAESASSIGHPNVVDVFDVHKTQDGIPYLVGEFLEGEELGEYLKRLEKLDVGTAVAVVRQVCRALAAAHARGIVHRDMKPENVFITERDGAPIIKVLDFGISKAKSTDSKLTRTGMIMGTPSYMAPEQARGETVDLRADVYAIGALLYQVLTGRRPFDSEDPAAVLSMVLTEEPPRPRSIEPSIPEALELVVQRAMAKDPRDRYQTTAELDAALAPFDSGLGIKSVLLPSPDGSVVSGGKRTFSSPDAGTAAQSFEATARTMMAGLAAPTSLEAGKAAKSARPTIVTVGLGLLLWLMGGFVDALGGVVRYFHEAELTPTESVMLMIGIAFIVASPSWVFVQRVRKVVWPNSVKAVELAADLKRTAAAALVTYGVGALAMRVTFTIGLRDSSVVAGGLWDAALFGASVLGAIVAGGVGLVARSLRRKANG